MSVAFNLVTGEEVQRWGQVPENSTISLGIRALEQAWGKT